MPPGVVAANRTQNGASPVRVSLSADQMWLIGISFELFPVSLLRYLGKSWRVLSFTIHCSKCSFRTSSDTAATGVAAMVATIMAAKNNVPKGCAQPFFIITNCAASI